MKNSRIFLISAVFCCASIGFEVGAQTCHTVRDKDGTIVYQSTRSPSDAPDTKQLVADAMQAGGTLRYESNFIRCGSFDRSASSPITAIAVETPTNIEAPTRQQQATRPAVDRNFVHAAPDKQLSVPNPTPTAAEIAAYGDFAKYVPRANNEPPNLFEHLSPKSATQEVPGGIFAGLRKEGEPAPLAEQPPAQATAAPAATHVDPVEWVMLAALWGGIALVAFVVFVAVNRVNHGGISALSTFILALRGLRVVLALLLITQAWTFIEAFLFAKANPAILSRLEFIVPVLFKLVWVAAFVLLFDYLRRRINSLHQRKFGETHPALKERWSL